MGKLGGRNYEKYHTTLLAET